MTTLGHHGLLFGENGGGAWDPSFLSPQLWFDDSTAVVDASGFASSWASKGSLSSSATNSTAAQQPLIVPAGLNGRRTLRFDGTDDRLLIANSRSLFQNALAGWIFIVCKKIGSDASAVSRSIVRWDTSTTGNIRFGIYANDGTAGQQNRPAVLARRLDANALTSTRDSVGRADTWVAVLATADWANRVLSLYVNGSLQGQATSAWDAGGTTSNTQSNYVGIAGSSTGATLFGGEIACLIAGAGAIPGTSDRTELFNWSLNRYGV